MRVQDVVARVAGDELVVLAGTTGEIDIRAVTVIDSWAQVRECAVGDLIVVPHYFTSAISGFELDTVVRYAADAGAAGFVFQRSARLPVTVVRLAQQAGVTVFAFRGESSLVDIVHRLDALIGAGEPSALLRAQAATATIRRLENDGDHATLVQAVSEVLGGAITVEWLTRPPLDVEPLLVNGITCGWIRAANADDAATQIILPHLARVVGDEYTMELKEQRRHNERQHEVVRLLAREGSSVPRTTTTEPQGDSWCLASITPAARGDRSDRSLDRAEWIARVAADQIRRSTGRASVITRFGTDLAIAFRLHVSGGTTTPPCVMTDLRTIMKALDALSGETYACGVAARAAEGSGILLSASQARASAYAARERRSTEIMVAEVSTLDVLLTQALDSPLAREAVGAILEPFDNLPRTNRHTMIETLAAYFDHHGSNSRAAQYLHLHPNAVAYRMKKALALVPAARTDPDVQLALHIASRLELLSSGARD